MILVCDWILEENTLFRGPFILFSTTWPCFSFWKTAVPTALPGVDPKILDPRDTYANAADWDVKAKDLAERFIKNFAKFTGNEAGKKLVAAGPKL